jgi:hypothetical protein
METISSFETSVDFYRTTRRYNSEDTIHICENLRPKIAYTNSQYDEMIFAWIVSIKLDSTFRQKVRVDVNKLK